jgi:hypothetical protein
VSNHPKPCSRPARAATPRPVPPGWAVACLAAGSALVATSALYAVVLAVFT